MSPKTLLNSMPIRVLAAAILVALSVPVPTYAASSETSAYITSVVTLTLRRTQHMKFGRMISAGTAGTVVLSPDGDYENPESNLVMVSGVSRLPAVFIATGEPDKTFGIVLPSSATITCSTNSATMTVDNFQSDPSSTGTLDGEDGGCTISVGARLNVGVNQTTGYYEGSFTVTVAYN